MYYVYVLQSKRDSDQFYLGSTVDLRQRLEQHNQGKVKTTQGHQWQLVYYEAYVTELAARDREHKLKHNGKARRFLMQRIKESLKTQ